MFSEYRAMQFERYTLAMDYLSNHPERLIELEAFITELVNSVIERNYAEIEQDYNEASYLNAFWSYYSPEARGRAPIGDQIPWIEVGEHAVGHKIERIIGANYRISEIGLPSGADNRFVLYHPGIFDLTDQLTDCVFVFLDIKSVGPRDNHEEAVLSPYQVSGNGIWDSPDNDLVNTPVTAVGGRATHQFYPSLSPIYVLSNGDIAPSIHLFIKPIYTMLTGDHRGQPLESIKSICVPNGILLTRNPGYLQLYPGLLYPGKDEAGMRDIKKRARVNCNILGGINGWRVQMISR